MPLVGYGGLTPILTFAGQIHRFHDTLGGFDKGV